MVGEDRDRGFLGDLFRLALQQSLELGGGSLGATRRAEQAAIRSAPGRLPIAPRTARAGFGS